MIVLSSEYEGDLMSKDYRVLEGKSGVRQAYDEMSKLYDTSRYLFWTRKMEEGESRIVEKWIRKLKSPILDLGCGTGRYAIKLAKVGYEIVALDISRGMLNVAIRKVRRMECEYRIHFVIGDGEMLPFRANSFGGIICALTFDHFLHPTSAAYEISRILKHNGLCIISTFNPHTFNDFRIRYNIPLDKVPFRTEEMPPTLIYEIPHSAGEVEDIFSNYGFKVVDVKGCCYWHLFPSFLMTRYPSYFDDLFNVFRSLIKYAEIHVTILKKL